jgi:hypothetical protein
VFGSSGLKIILLKTGFHYAQVPFKAGLTVFETIKNSIYKLMDNFALTLLSAGSVLHSRCLLFRKKAVFDIGVLCLNFCMLCCLKTLLLYRVAKSQQTPNVTNLLCTSVNCRVSPRSVLCNLCVICICCSHGGDYALFDLSGLTLCGLVGIR